MDESQLKIVESFPCVRCGAACAVETVGDLLVSRCPDDGVRHILTVSSPQEAGTSGVDASLVGQELGPCRVVGPAGFEGGLPLYHGLNVALNQPHAIRVLRGEAARDRAAMQRFVAAGKLAAAVRHGVLANVIHLGRLADGLFAIAPELSGRPFDQALGAGRLGVHETIRVGRRLAEALAALHERGIVHRNIGPKTVCMLANGEPVLRNFAFATGPNASGDPDTVVGQPGYFAPEQVGGGAVDARADIYSLGGLLYLGLVGAPVFAGATPAAVVRSRAEGPGHVRGALESAAPLELAGLVARMLAEDPEERPASAREVLDALALPAEPRASAPETDDDEEGVLPIRGGGLSLGLEEGQLAVLEPEVPSPKAPSAPEPPLAEEPPAPAHEPASTDWLELAPSRSAGEASGREPPSIGLRDRAPESRPREPAPEPRPQATQQATPAPPQSDEPPDAGEVPFELDDEPPLEITEVLPLEGEEPRPSRRGLYIALGGLAALALVVFAARGLFFGDSKPARKPRAAKPKAREPKPKAVKLSAAEKAESTAAKELDKLRAFAKKNARRPGDVVEQCDAFLELYDKTAAAETARELRAQAAAVLREDEAQRQVKQLGSALKDSKKTVAERLAAVAAFIEKYEGTKAVEQAERLRERFVEKREKAAETALRKVEKDVAAHREAKAYGKAIGILRKLVAEHEATKPAQGAAAELAALERTVTQEFERRKDAARTLVREREFAAALEQLGPALSVWEVGELKAEAEQIAGLIHSRRDQVVSVYGPFVGEFARRVAAVKFEEALALARETAAKAGHPTLKGLVEGAPGDAELLLAALDRVVTGAQAQMAKAAGSGGKVWVQRGFARFKAAIDKPTRAGLIVDIPGLKGQAPWSTFPFSQLVTFARSAPEKPTPGDHHAVGLLALYGGNVGEAFEEFGKAVDSDPAAAKAIAASLRRHAQGFVYIPPGEFRAGRDKRPARLPGFLLACREVTNTEYAFYVRAAGAAPPPGWTDGRFPRGRDEYPVGNIPWKDADAYARWLGMRLPDALEWERAVRDTTGRLYPWGDKYAAGQAILTSPDGRAKSPRLFAATRHLSRADDSPFFHLCGNVREWTGSPGRDRRIQSGYYVVGGSATDKPDAARGYERTLVPPAAADPFTGFRLAWPR